MKTNMKKIILFTIMFIFVLAFFETVSLGTGDLDTSQYNVGLSYSDATYIFDKGASVLELLRNIAAIVAFVTLSIIGVRYMIGSVEQKAEYKQTMMPVVVGCILVGSLSAILTVIQSIF